MTSTQHAGLGATGLSARAGAVYAHHGNYQSHSVQSVPLMISRHKLKDSAYWYHMHYTHGISYTTGKEFDKPVEWRPANSAAGAEALCGGCRQWIYIGRHDGGKWKTPYYRHAYRCQTKNKANGQSIRNRPKSTSPRRSAAKQVKRL